MHHKTLWLIGYLALACVLSACSFVSQQLSDKRMEEQLLKPGALDSPVATNFDEYHFRFLDKYRVVHAWPVTSACKYSGFRTKYKMGETSYGDVHWVLDIIEEGNNTRQRDATPGSDFNRFVRSVKVQRPVYETANGTRGIVRYEEREEGLGPICFEAWVGTDHSLTIRLVKLPMSNRVAHYEERVGSRSKEKVGSNVWQVWRYQFDAATPNRYGGEIWVLPIGETDYTLALEFGFGAESFQSPPTHAAFEAMFKHIVESVRVEPLTPAIETEMEELKVRAFEIVRQNCIQMAKRTKPPAYCQKYLKP